MTRKIKNNIRKQKYERIRNETTYRKNKGNYYKKSKMDYFICLKMILQRPRPEEFRIINESGYSFPSGHSMISMAFYGFLIYLIYKNVKNKYLKWTLITIYKYSK